MMSFEDGLSVHDTTLYEEARWLANNALQSNPASYPPDSCKNIRITPLFFRHKTLRIENV